MQRSTLLLFPKNLVPRLCGGREPAQPMVSVGTQTAMDYLRFLLRSPSTSSRAGPVAPRANRKVGAASSASIPKQRMTPSAPPATLPTHCRGQPACTSAAQRTRKKPSKQITSKGQLSMATDGQVDESVPRSSEDAPPMIGVLLSVSSDSTLKQIDPHNKHNTPWVKIDFKP